MLTQAAIQASAWRFDVVDEDKSVQSLTMPRKDVQNIFPSGSCQNYSRGFEIVLAAFWLGAGSMLKGYFRFYIPFHSPFLAANHCVHYNHLKEEGGQGLM